MKKINKLAVGFLATAVYIGSCFAVGNKNQLTVAGSSALLPLTLTAVKDMKASYPNLKILSSGQGSTSGLQALQNGSADIAAADWDASKDIGQIKATQGLVAYKVALTPFSTVVNPDVKVSSLNREQLQGIFSGKYKNWKEVGGNDLPIVVINRSYGSGTRINYQAEALGNSKFMKSGDNYKEVGTSGEMVANIASTPGSIGYLDLVYIKGDKIKPVSYNGVAASEKNILNGSYKIWGYGYYLTKGPAVGMSKAFINYVQSKKFQLKSLPKLGFISITKLNK